jgi:hypothetical protein
MKKNRTTNQEQKRKPHRLRLNRETIHVLDDPALLGLARGGITRAERDGSGIESCETSTVVSSATSC